MISWSLSSALTLVISQSFCSLQYRLPTHIFDILQHHQRSSEQLRMMTVAHIPRDIIDVLAIDILVIVRGPYAGLDLPAVLGLSIHPSLTTTWNHRKTCMANRNLNRSSHRSSAQHGCGYATHSPLIIASSFCSDVACFALPIFVCPSHVLVSQSRL